MPSFFSRNTVKDFFAHLATTHWFRVAICLAVAIIGIGYGVGFAIGSRNAKNAFDEDYVRRAAIHSAWQLDVTQQFTLAESLAASIASFALATADAPMNATAPAEERLKVTNPIAFEQQCIDLAGSLSGIYTVSILSGGVVAQACPKDSLTVGYDSFTSPTYIATYLRMLEEKGPIKTGPTPMETVKDGIAINSWYPIFINGSTVNRTIDSFWGATVVMMELGRLVEQKGMKEASTAAGLEFVMWWDETDAEGNVVESIIATNVEDDRPDAASAIEATKRDGMRVDLPVAGEGKRTYFALYPKGGPPSKEMSTDLIVMIIFVVLAGDIAAVALLFLGLYAAFCFRHRHAPDGGSIMCGVFLTLRGAQPVVERAPLEAVRMLTEFLKAVRVKGVDHGCYPTADIGDRTILVVCKSAEQAYQLAKECVFDVSIHGSAQAEAKRSTAIANDLASEESELHPMTDSPRENSRRSRSYSRATGKSASQAKTNKTGKTSKTKATTDAATSHSSSFIGTAICRPSAIINVAPAKSHYDASRDMYFFGNTHQLGGICALLDGTKGGEVAWTVEADTYAGPQCRALEQCAVSTHIVSEGNEVIMHVASLWKETGDERDNEDPSTAMAALNDVYIRKMTTIIADGRAEKKAKRRKDRLEAGDNNSSSKNSSERVNATAVMRVATILHIATLDDSRMPLDIIRRIVSEEKGAVVSGHENVLVAAFNLLTPGGHHQVRAADTVMRLRAALPNTPFVCSLHYGKVNALIVDGLVLCSGEAVSIGRALLMQAVSLRELAMRNPANNVTPFASSAKDRSYVALSGTSPLVNANKEPIDTASVTASALSTATHGLCVLLFGLSELSSTYECEAVDVIAPSVLQSLSIPLVGQSSAAILAASSHVVQRNSAIAVNGYVSSDKEVLPKSRVLYSLAARKSGKANDDEWMYRLKDEEDASPFAAVNAVFNRIACGDFSDAGRLWAKSKADPNVMMAISNISKASIERYITPSHMMTGATLVNTNLAGGGAGGLLSSSIHGIARPLTDYSSTSPTAVGAPTPFAVTTTFRNAQQTNPNSVSGGGAANARLSSSVRDRSVDLSVVESV